MRKVSLWMQKCFVTKLIEKRAYNWTLFSKMIIFTTLCNSPFIQWGAVISIEIKQKIGFFMCVLHCSNLDISRLVYFLARFMNEELLLLLLRCFEVPSWTSCHDLVGIQKGNLLALRIPPRSGVHTLLLLLKNGRAIQRSPDLSAHDMFQFFALI